MSDQKMSPAVRAATQAGMDLVHRLNPAQFLADAFTAAFRNPRAQVAPYDPLFSPTLLGWRHDCDCGPPYHRWNCALTPIWAATMRDLDVNPWTVIRPRDLALVDPDRIHDHCYGGDDG